MSSPTVHTESVKLRAAGISVAVTLILIVAKVIAGWLSGSLALYSLAVDSAFDFLGVVFTLIAVRVAALPPDEDHHYGHGKFDSIAALFQNLFLISISTWIGYEAVSRLVHPPSETVKLDALTICILGFSFALDIWRSIVLRQVARRTSSHSLAADSLHFLADAMSVIVVLCGVILAKYFDLPAADAIAAIAVTGFIIVQSAKQTKDAIDVLMDRMPVSDDYNNIAQAVCQSDGVVSLENLKIRRASSTLFVDVVAGIDRILPYAAIQAIVAEVEMNIRTVQPFANVHVLWKPMKTEDESPFDTIKLITSELGILPHNIELSKDEKGEVTLDLHIEFPSGSTFNSSHAKSEAIEAEILAQLPQIHHVVTHLEEERSDVTITDVRNMTATDPGIVDRVTTCIKASCSSITDIRNITLWKTIASGEVKLALTIELPKDLSLIAAHDLVTEAENVLRSHFPELGRIVIHSEPKP